MSNETAREKSIDYAKRSSEQPPRKISEGSVPAHESQHPSLAAQRYMAKVEVYGANRNDSVAAEHLAKMRKLLGMKQC
jgi:hypothetical protein